MIDLELNYMLLCKLHDRYKYLVANIVKHAYSKPSPEVKIAELDKILKAVERLPISWKFYMEQPIKFTQDFEDLIVFCDKSDIDI